jgi:hypothetical protein
MFTPFNAQCNYTYTLLIHYLYITNSLALKTGLKPLDGVSGIYKLPITNKSREAIKRIKSSSKGDDVFPGT